MSLNWKTVLFLVFYYSRCSLVLAQTPQLIPQMQIGYSGNRVSFSCIANRGVKYWYINGSYADTRQTRGGPLQTRVSLSTDGHTSQLSFMASLDTNNSVVTCLVSNEEIHATLLVQGTVDVKNIETYDGNRFISLSWIRPYTLPETELEYRVTVSVKGYSKSVSTLQESHSFLYLDLNISRCYSNNQANFTVQGLNPAGEGEPTSISIFIPQNTSLCTEADLLEGKLGPPTQFIASFSNYSVTLTWMSPSTLTSISHYLIEAKSDNTSFVVRTNTTTPTHSFTYTDLDINRCTSSYRFELTVAGVNFVGVGDSLNITVTIPQDHKYCQDSLSDTVTFTEFNKFAHSETTTTFTTFSMRGTEIVQYYAIGIVFGTLVIVLITLVAIIYCVLKKKTKQRTVNFHLDLNNCYATTDLKNNPSYATTDDLKKNPSYELADPGPIYEEIPTVI